MNGEDQGELFGHLKGGHCLYKGILDIFWTNDRQFEVIVSIVLAIRIANLTYENTPSQLSDEKNGIRNQVYPTLSIQVH